MTTSGPDTAAPLGSRGVLVTLTKARLLELAREHELSVASSASKEALADSLAGSGALRFRELLQRLGRDELRAASKAHGLPADSRSRPALMAQLLQAHGAADSIPPAPLFTGREKRRDLPEKNDIVRCRHRQWLVDDVRPPASPGEATLVSLVCLDDDNQGRPLEVFWERELGARVLQPEAHGLGDVDRIDPPRHFAAYLHALKWNAVTATDARLFQAPFRAGIQLMDHQLTPLKKALQLPRVNLFIADDVGLGKTIEAGLVLQELLLRQRVEYVLIVAPPSVALQWQGEMQLRFGLHFEIYNRAFVGRRRQERGFVVNPWSTHHRFIVSYQTLRRPEHRDALLAHLAQLSRSASGAGTDRARKSLLILDEAHTAAPSSASKYAIDSRITRVIRGLTGAFENRLFLSATPHNGHSNSFSALLEMLDPNRFTRGVDVDPGAREAVMVRRLKEDLRQLGRQSFPRRDVLRVDLQHDGAAWSASYALRAADGTATPASPTGQPLGEAPPVELTLAAHLAEYTDLMKPERGTGRLVFVNLQKRLLSSVAAFHRTLQLHAAAVDAGKARTQLALGEAPIGEPVVAPTSREEDDDVYGPDDEQLEAQDDHEAALSSRVLESPAGRARTLLDAMLRLGRDHRADPDAKVLALLDWMRRHQCPGVRVGGVPKGAPKAERAWNDTRVLIFTEYGDTKKWLRELLDAALAGTDQADARIMEFHGGMSDDQRAAVQDAFNGPPSEHPVRILLATDAAREGVNLQGFCADLFHFDIPWNPARIEQRNGRIDRTLQPADVVRCHYFVYPGRAEDVVLDTLVEKVGVIRRELGSLGSVVMERLDQVLSRGIDRRTQLELTAASEGGKERESARAELEVERADLKKLAKEIDEAGSILASSAKVLDFDPPLLRDAIDVGLELAGVPARLARVGTEGDAWKLPPMPDSWQQTLDAIRPPRGELPYWEWRKRPLPPVTFTPPRQISDRRVHLHLSHPLVQRVMSQFLAQGFGAHDLSRVTVVRSRHDHVVRAIAFGRLSLFGPGATRLHDQLVMVAAQIPESALLSGAAPTAGTEADDRKALGRLEQLLSESPTLEHVSQATQAQLRARAPQDFTKLWEPIRLEADALSHEAEARLRARGKQESAALRRILETQTAGIAKKLDERRQGVLPFTGADKDSRDAREQWENETAYLEERKATIARDLATEPASIEAGYEIKLRRLEPVGLVYIWPETKG
jgi:hypothetical protein